MKKIVLQIVPIITMSALLICSCKESKPTSRNFFDFDEVTYYSTDKSFRELISRDEKKVKTLKDSVLIKVMSVFEEGLSYDVAVPYLDSIGFKKQVIPIAKHQQINVIFSERNSINETATTCEPVYRDIYVFKKNGKISGIAKLCYECGDSRFIGTQANTQSFGSKDEYSKLKKLLNE